MFASLVIRVLVILRISWKFFSSSSVKIPVECKCFFFYYLLQFPERFFHLDSGVTAVDFSAAHPNLLAVSNYLLF